MTKLFGSVDSSCVAGRQSVTVSTRVGLCVSRICGDRPWGCHRRNLLWHTPQHWKSGGWHCHWCTCTFVINKGTEWPRLSGVQVGEICKRHTERIERNLTWDTAIEKARDHVITMKDGSSYVGLRPSQLRLAFQSMRSNRSSSETSAFSTRSTPGTPSFL